MVARAQRLLGVVSCLSKGKVRRPYGLLNWLKRSENIFCWQASDAQKNFRTLNRASAEIPENGRSKIVQLCLLWTFNEGEGEKNKILPTPFKEVEPLLLNKQFYYMAELDPSLILQSDFPKFVANYFQAG